MTTGISFTDQFKCINSECSYNCCGGWQIEIDEETYLRYIKEEGAFGRKLRRNMCYREVPQIRQRFGKCPYLTKDRLCGMYLEHGEEYMSFACRTFPRRKIDYATGNMCCLEELYLELSCPEVARLFLEEEGFIRFEEVNRETETCWQFEIEEPDYFEKLLLMRDAITNLMHRKDISLSHCMMLVFDYAAECQQLAMRLKYEAIVDFTKEYLKEEQLQTRIAEYKKYEVSYSQKGSLLHTFVSEGVEQMDIRWRNPGMAKVLKKYYKCFENKDFSKFGELVSKSYDRMLHKQPELEMVYRNYFLYYISQRLLFAIQSYNMTKPVIMGIVHTQLLILFHIVLWKCSKESLSKTAQRDILAYYSRTAGHNESICDKMYEYVSKSEDMRTLLEDYIL